MKDLRDYFVIDTLRNGLIRVYNWLQPSPAPILAG